MAYEFKKLSEVNAVESLGDNSNILIEENGAIVKKATSSMIPSDMVSREEFDQLSAKMPYRVNIMDGTSISPDYLTVVGTTDFQTIVNGIAGFEGGFPIIQRMVSSADGSSVKYYCIGESVVNNNNMIRRLKFGNNLTDIIIDANENRVYLATD